MKAVSCAIMGLALAVGVSGVASSWAEETTAYSGTYIPRGDPQQGRNAFVFLQCTTCHRVKDDPSLPAPTGLVEGSTLRDPSMRKGPGYILDSILLPSHYERGSKPPAGWSSPMATYYPHAMTVQQLLDLAAYLDSKSS